MAVLQKEFNVMGLPMAISRNNPIPLDKTAVWYNEMEMRSYAATNPTAYVGQVLSLVNETTRTATAYIITSTSGALKEVGAAVMVDDQTLVLNDDSQLGLNDFEKAFYKYVPATDTEDAKYVKVNVGDLDAEGNAYTWSSGLEPKAVLENGKFVLGWYEPNPTTMEGVSASIAALQNSVNEINGDITALENKDSELSTGLQTVKNDLQNRYTKEEANKAIADAVAAADHLKRKKVDSVDDIVVDAPDASQYIYMVPTGLEADDDKYDEYMVIDGAVEKVGSWEVDLSNYATKSDLDKKVEKKDGYSLVLDTEIAKLSTVKANAEPNFVKSAGSEFGVDDNGNLTLEAIPADLDLSSNVTVQELQTGLGTKVAKRDGYDLVSTSLINKLEALPADAEKNVINEVETTEFVIDENRKLSIVSVAATKISDLSKNSEFAEVLSDITSMQTDISDIETNLISIQTSINTNASAIKTLNSSLTTLKGRVDTHDDDIAALKDALTWKDLAE